MDITAKYTRLIFELSYRMPLVNESNLEYKLTDKNKISNSNPLVLNLYMVSKAFYYCYKIANENNKLILNIILNKNLTENILCIIKDDSLSNINEIKNNILSNVDTNLYRCKKNKKKGKTQN